MITPTEGGGVHLEWSRLSRVLSAEFSATSTSCSTATTQTGSELVDGDDVTVMDAVGWSMWALRVDA
ncbi:MAG: hypothetical protein ACR2K2_03410 [Mycobacteriales bacterium]